MLLRGDVAFVVDPPVEEDGTIALTRLLIRPQRRARQPGVPERAVGKRAVVMQGVQLVQRLHLRLVTGDDELREVGGAKGRRCTVFNRNKHAMVAVLLVMLGRSRMCFIFLFPE